MSVAKEILVPFPDKSLRDGAEIKTWMDGWLVGYQQFLTEGFSYEQMIFLMEESYKAGLNSERLEKADIINIMREKDI